MPAEIGLLEQASGQERGRIITGNILIFAAILPGECGLSGRSNHIVTDLGPGPSTNFPSLWPSLKAIPQTLLESLQRPANSNSLIFFFKQKLLEPACGPPFSAFLFQRGFIKLYLCCRQSSPLLLICKQSAAASNPILRHLPPFSWSAPNWNYRQVWFVLPIEWQLSLKELSACSLHDSQPLWSPRQ